MARRIAKSYLSFLRPCCTRSRDARFDRFVSFLSLFALPKSGSETVCGQEEIRNCAQWFGTGPPSKRVPRHHTFFRVSSFVCPVTSRAGTQEICGPWNERLLSGRRTPMLIRNATFIAFDPVNFARYTDSSLSPLFFYPTSVLKGLSASRIYFGYLLFRFHSFFTGDLLRSRWK